MEKYREILENFPEHEHIDISSIKIVEHITKEQIYRWFGMLDVTTLEVTDTPNTVAALCRKVANIRDTHPNLPTPASICVYPSLVESAGLALGDSDIRITSVAGGFPSAQTFVEVKALECAMAEESGADEIDVVMNLGAFLGGDFGTAEGELEIIRGELSEDTVLKVIIESGSLPDMAAVRAASLLALSAGADFIKTSTGKNGVGATPEAVAQMCEALIDYEAVTEKKCGIKIAGGVRTVEQLAEYYAIVEAILGEEWIEDDGLRFGASSLMDELLARA